MRCCGRFWGLGWSGLVRCGADRTLTVGGLETVFFQYIMGSLGMIDIKTCAAEWAL